MLWYPTTYTKSGATRLGAGAVGLYAVQLAHIRGARVITTVSAQDIDFVKRLGVDEAIDYKAFRFEKEVRDVDVVFDTVGGDTFRGHGVSSSQVDV